MRGLSELGTFVDELPDLRVMNGFDVASVFNESTSTIDNPRISDINISADSASHRLSGKESALGEIVNCRFNEGFHNVVSFQG